MRELKLQGPDRHDGRPAVSLLYIPGGALLRKHARITYLVRATPPDLVLPTAITHDEHMPSCVPSIMETAVLRRAATDRQWQSATLRVSEGGLGILPQAPVAPCAFLASIINIALTSRRLLRARPQLRPVWSSWGSGRMAMHRHAQRSYTFVRQFYSVEDLDRGALHLLS